MTTAYPLSWPEGWARTRADLREDSRFRFKSRIYGDDSTRAVTFDVAMVKLHNELQRLGATDLVISTNLPLRRDGQPSAEAARLRIHDPGVAIYFTLKGCQMSMACDKYDAPSANMRSRGCASSSGTAAAP